MKLSQTQFGLLQDAAFKLKRDRGTSEVWRRIEDGWFPAQFTSRGSIELFCRPQTARSLVGLGLLEVRTVGAAYWDRRAKKWRYNIEYRISPKGLEMMDELQ